MICVGPLISKGLPTHRFLPLHSKAVIYLLLKKKKATMSSDAFIIWAAAAAKSLQSCPTLCDPIDGSHQAPPSLGFSRQEYWSGLPFPSPMHESEK